MTPFEEDVRFAPLTPHDLPLVYEWLLREHVRRWWNDEQSYEDFCAEYLGAIEGREPTRAYLILLEAAPVGFIQTYLVADYPEWEIVVGVGPGVAGIDLFLADESLTGRGIGTAALRLFLDTVVFADPATIACIGDPEPANAASMRMLEKAGFQRVREILDPLDRRQHVLMRRERHVAA